MNRHLLVLLATTGLIGTSVGDTSRGGEGTTVAVDSGTILRSSIPNDYLDVDMTGGTARVVGTTEVNVTWVGANAAYVRERTATEKHNLELGGAVRGSAPDLLLRVPANIRMLHLHVHGRGQVELSGLSGEVTVVLDSGSIAARGLTGATILEARHGGVRIDLSEGEVTGNPVYLLAQDGSVDVTLKTNPSVALDLTANCGRIESDFSLAPESAAGNSPPSNRNPKAAEPAIDCGAQPAGAATAPGVLSQQNAVRKTLGDGRRIVRARAVQGDILLRRPTVMVAAPSQGRAAEPSLTATRELRIDGEAANLSAVSGITTGRDGTIVVAQQQDGLLRFFSSTGKALGTFGHSGGGPGEFQEITRMSWVADTLLVFDRKLNRVTYIAANRTLMRTTPLPVLSGVAGGLPPLTSDVTLRGLLGGFSNGDLLVDLSVYAAMKEKLAWGKLFPGQATLVARVTPTGVIEKVTTFQNATYPPECFGVPECPRSEWAFVPEADHLVDVTPVSTTPKNGAYTYRIRGVEGSTGRSLFTKEMTFSGPPLSKREADSLRAAALRTANPALTATIKTAIIPPVKYPVTLVYVGRDGSTWIRLRGANAKADRPWVVLDPRGNVVGRLMVPARIFLWSGSLTEFVGTETDDDGLESIVRYQVKRAAAPPAKKAGGGEL